MEQTDETSDQLIISWLWILISGGGIDKDLADIILMRERKCLKGMCRARFYFTKSGGCLEHAARGSNGFQIGARIYWEWSYMDPLQAEEISVTRHHVWHRYYGPKGLFQCYTVQCSHWMLISICSSAEVMNLWDWTNRTVSWVVVQLTSHSFHWTPFCLKEFVLKSPLDL